MSLSCFLYILVKEMGTDLGQRLLPKRGDSLQGPPPGLIPVPFPISSWAQEVPFSGIIQAWEPKPRSLAQDKGHQIYLAWWEGCQRLAPLSGMAGCSFEKAWHPVGLWLVG